MKLKLFAVALVAASAFACGGVSSPSSNVQQQFTLPLQPGGYTDVVPVNVTSNGSLEYEVFVQSVTPTPPSSGYIGVIFGEYAGPGNCIPTYGPTTGIIGHTVASGPIQPGSWCVQFFDPGVFQNTTTLSGPSTVTGYVSHP